MASDAYSFSFSSGFSVTQARPRRRQILDFAVDCRPGGLSGIHAETPTEPGLFHHGVNWRGELTARRGLTGSSPRRGGSAIAGAWDGAGLLPLPSGRGSRRGGAGRERGASDPANRPAETPPHPPVALQRVLLSVCRRASTPRGEEIPSSYSGDRPSRGSDGSGQWQRRRARLMQRDETGKSGAMPALPPQL